MEVVLAQGSIGFGEERNRITVTLKRGDYDWQLVTKYSLQPQPGEREYIQDIQKTGTPQEAFAWATVRAYNLLMEGLGQHSGWLAEQAEYKPKSVAHVQWMNEFCELVEEAQ